MHHFIRRKAAAQPRSHALGRGYKQGFEGSIPPRHFPRNLRPRHDPQSQSHPHFDLRLPDDPDLDLPLRREDHIDRRHHGLRGGIPGAAWADLLAGGAAQGGGAVGADGRGRWRRDGLAAASAASAGRRECEGQQGWLPFAKLHHTSSA